MLQLGQEVVQVQVAFQGALLHPRHFLLIQRALRLLYQAHHVPHAQDPRGHPVGVKRLQVFRLLAHADKQDGTSRHRLHGQRGAAARVAVELRQHDAVEVQPLRKRAGDVHGLLASHRVEHEQLLVDGQHLLDRLELAHQRVVDVQPARGVDDDDVAAVVLRAPGPQLDDLRRVLLLAVAVHQHADAVADHVQLVDGRRAVDVRRDEQGLAPLLLEPQRQLAAERGLARALQAHDHHHGLALVLRLRRIQVQLARGAAQQRGQFLVDDPDHLLRRRERAQHVLPEGLVADPAHEVLGDVVIDVGLEQGQAHLAERVLDVVLGQTVGALQLLERGV